MSNRGGILKHEETVRLDGERVTVVLMRPPLALDPCWYAYLSDDAEPYSQGAGVTTLRDIQRWIRSEDGLHWLRRALRGRTEELRARVPD